MDMPTKEQILEAANECPQAKIVLKKLWPSIFEEERLQIGDIVKYVGDMTPFLKNHIGMLYKCDEHYDNYYAFWDGLSSEIVRDKGEGGYHYGVKKESLMKILRP